VSLEEEEEEEETDDLGMARLDDELAQFTAKAFDPDGYATSFFEEHPFIEVTGRRALLNIA